MRTEKQIYAAIASSTDYGAFYFLRNCEQEKAVEGTKGVIVESIMEGINEMDYCYDPLDKDSVY